MKKRSYRVITTLLLLFLSTHCRQGGATSGFDAGHEWIMPRPAAEIHLVVVDAKKKPVEEVTAWIYFGDQKVKNADRFIDYDLQDGIRGSSSGEVILHYLGEGGGGYEVPLDAATPPKLGVWIEASGYKHNIVNLDDILFTSKYRTGKREIEYKGKTIEMVVVEYVVTLEEE